MNFFLESLSSWCATKQIKKVELRLSIESINKNHDLESKVLQNESRQHRVNDHFFLQAIQLSELDAILAKLSTRVLPSICNYSVAVGKAIVQCQHQNLHLAKQLYSLIYTCFIKETKSKYSISHESMMKDILLDKNVRIQPPSGLISQIITNMLKTLYKDPYEFAQSLSQINNNHGFHSFFAFTTFPALYSYFTVSEFLNLAVDFLKEFIQLQVPDNIVIQYVVSISFSSFQFLEAFWISVYHLLHDRKSPTGPSIFGALIGSAINCALLISPQIKSIYLLLFQYRPQLLHSVFSKYVLPISFNLWLDNTSYGLSFLSQDAILEFIPDLPEEFILAIIQTPQSVDTVPSPMSYANISHSTLIFSHYDIFNITRAFKMASQKIVMFEKLDDFIRSIPIDFCSFEIEFFFSGSVHIDNTLVPLIGRSEFPPIQVEYDPVYDFLSQQTIEAHDEKLDAYIKGREICRFYELLDLQESLISQKLHLNLMLDFQKSISRLFEEAFSYYVRISIPNPCPRDFPQRFLAGCSEAKTLNMAVFCIAFDYSTFDSSMIPSSLFIRFQEVAKQALSNFWLQYPNFPAMRFGRLISVLKTQRKDLKMGKLFRLFSQVLIDIRNVKENFHVEEDLMQYVMYAAKSEVLMNLFLFFEKVAFSDEDFARSIPSKLFLDWSFFFQMMWSLLGLDPDLLSDCLHLNLKTQVYGIHQ